MGCDSVAPDVALLAQTSRFLEAPAFACYKGLCFSYFLAWCVIWPFSYEDMYLFLTWWAWYIGALYFALSFLTACSHMRRQRAALAHLQRLPHDGDGDGGGSGPEPSWSILTGDMTAPLPLRTHIPRLERTLLVSQLLAWNLACVGSLVVCAVFWTALYDGSAVSSVDINAHGFFAVIMVIDQFLVASRYHLRDMWKPAAVGTMYLVFNITYYYTAPLGEKLIYYILDWGRDPWEAVAYSVLAVFVLVPLFGTFHYGVFRLREHVFATCRKRVETSPDLLQDHLLDADADNSGTHPVPSDSRESQAGTSLV